MKGKRLLTIAMLLVVLAAVACGGKQNGILDIRVEIGPMPKPAEQFEDLPQSFKVARELVIRKDGASGSIKSFQMGGGGPTAITTGSYQNIFALESGSYIAEVPLLSGDSSTNAVQSFEIIPNETKLVTIEVVISRP